MSDETRKHEFEIEIAAPPDEVWRAITEGDRITRWFCPKARVDPGMGGKVWMSWGPGMEGEAPITIWEPAKRFGWTESHASGPRIVEFQVEARGGKTVLRLVHSGFGAAASFDDEYDSTRGGWTSFLALLRHDVEKSAGQPARHTCKLVMSERSSDNIMQDLLRDIRFSDEGDGHYSASLPSGTAIGGRILVRIHSTHLVLTADQLDGSAVGLFAERYGGAAAVTTSWYLKGASVEKESEILAGWNELVDRVATAEAPAR